MEWSAGGLSRWELGGILGGLGGEETLVGRGRKNLASGMPRSCFVGFEIVVLGLVSAAESERKCRWSVFGHGADLTSGNLMARALVHVMVHS